MITQSYKNYINSPVWKSICAAYWAKYGRSCKACGAKKNLHVHHMTYERFGGRERLTDLLGLCHTCHRAVHSLHIKSGRKDLLKATLTYVVKKRSELRKVNK